MKMLSARFLAFSIGLAAASAAALRVCATPDATTALSARAYVQNGIVAQWDGIENAGLGLHDDATNRWIDLVGARHLTLNDKYGSFSPTSLVCACNSSGYAAGGADACTDYLTGEFLCDPHTTSAYVFCSGDNSNNRCLALYSGDLFLVKTGDGKWLSGGRSTLAATYSGNNVSGRYTNGVATVQSGSDTWGGRGTKISIGCGYSNYSYPYKGNVYGIRLYARVLSSDELLWNAMLDRHRYFGAALDESQEYGGHRVSNGQVEVRITASALGVGSAIRVNAGTAGSPASAWVALGSSVTLTPVPADGFKFYRWTGNTNGLTIAANGVATLDAWDVTTRTCEFISSNWTGVVRTWTGAAGDGQWFTAGNWDPEGVPAANDAVEIAAGTVSLTNATAALAYFKMTGSSAKMLFSEPVRAAPADLVTALKADTVRLLEGASMNHVTNLQSWAEFHEMATPAWLMDGRVNIACGTLELDASSKINVGGRGYFTRADPAPGPGGISAAATSGTVTPSHGSWSGEMYRFVSESTTLLKATPYGAAAAPVWPGSAGHAKSPGGGAVRIKATGRVTIEGQILACGGLEGSSVVGNSWRAGTGGSIFISCGSIAGSGLLAVNSGQVDLSGSLIGSAGRIAVTYDVTAQNAADAALGGVPALRFSARSYPTTNRKTRSLSRSGTVYFTDARFLTDTFSSARGVQYGDIRCADWSLWNPTGSLTVDNGVIALREGPALSLNLSGALTVTGENAELDIGGGGGMLLNNRSSLMCGQPRAWSAAPLALKFGSISLGTQSFLEIYAGPTNATSAVRNEVTVAGAITLAKSAQLLLTCHPTNAAVVRVTADSLDVASSATIHSNGWGWPGSYYGMGPGAPTAFNSCGAGYGGAAHIFNSTAGAYGHPYGNPETPIWPGSGGALSYSQNYGSSGGGVVWLEVTGDAVVNGSLSAAGQGQLGGSSGSGSGGSVYLKCRTLTGSGVLSAAGGYGQFASSAGAGGRIAVHYDAAAQAAIGRSNVRFTTATSSAYDTSSRKVVDFGSVWLTDATLLGDSLTPARGVYGGSVYLGSNWEEWRPKGLLVSNAWARLMCGGHDVTIDGDVLVTGNSELGFGGGDYAWTNNVRRYAFTKGPGPRVRVNGSVTITNVAGSVDATRSELWVLAGDRCGTDARTGADYAAQLEVTRTLRVCASNAQLRTMCHPNDGWGARIAVRDLTVENGGVISADAGGCQGVATWGYYGGGAGGGRGPGSGGGYGGKGGGGSAAQQGPVYGDAELPLLGGSGGGWYSAQGNQQYPGAGGGLVWLDVRRTARIDGTIRANGGWSSGDHNGGGSGGGVFLRCKTWDPGPSAWLSAVGGRAGRSNSGYGGGGGRIAVWRWIDRDPTPEAERTYATVEKGISVYSVKLPEVGTIRWVHAPPERFCIFLR